MFLIVGLGNPGEEYEHTRHNAGFDTVDKIASEIGVRYWKNECGALTGKGAYHDIDVVLAKPQSYMNTSGGPVKQLMNAYGVSPDCLVVIHDERLDRTTDGSGRVCDHSFAELQQVNAAACYKGKYAPEHIPSFDEYCEWASGESVGHNIEIKTDKIYYHDIERKIWATIERYGLEKKVMFSSFNHISLRKILEISGNAVEVGALVLEDSIGGFPGYYCQQAGFACYHPPIELLTDENVRDCKEHGVKMNVWTVNDMAGLEQLHRWGCEGIITNFPGVASGWLRAQGE